MTQKSDKLFILPGELFEPEMLRMCRGCAGQMSLLEEVEASG